MVAQASLERRDEVFLTGAYSCAKYGCITDIGLRILAAFPHLQATVSQHSPTDSTSESPRWVPPDSCELSDAALHRPDRMLG